MWNKFKNFVGGVSTGVKAVIVFWTLFVLLITFLALFPEGALVTIVLLCICGVVTVVSSLVYIAFS